MRKVKKFSRVFLFFALFAFLPIARAVPQESDETSEETEAQDDEEADASDDEEESSSADSLDSAASDSDESSGSDVSSDSTDSDGNSGSPSSSSSAPKTSSAPSSSSSSSSSSASTEKTVINIESAQKSEYKKDSQSGGDCIVLTGDVKISVSKGGKKTVITADSVNYNRKTEMLYAEGSVKLEQTGTNAGEETISASSLLFNTSTLEGIFDNGRAIQASSDAINLPSGSTLIVASDIFGRDSSGTIAFKTGELTFCDDENPHWKIKASRIWLLPGGEFAFLNAVLYVGFFPVMYFPAFYYPKDELIFNPAFGYKAREGYFINTTTYLYGRKSADAASTSDSDDDDDDSINFFSFMQTSNMKEQVREGLVLHNLDEDFTGDTTNYLKIMADYYSNLGAMTGFDTVIKPKNPYISEIDGNLEIGFSRTVFKSSDGTYLPYTSSGEEVRDSATFLSLTTPFRYQANLKFVLAKPLSLTLSLPIYSDKYFDYDFNNRAETMDWIDFLMSGGGDDDDDYEDEVTVVSSFTWSLSGSYTFSVPEIVNPYISSLAVTSFSSSIVHTSKINSDYESKETGSWTDYSPERYFYYPSQIIPFKIAGKVAGTIYQYPAASSTSKTKSPAINLNIPREFDTTASEDSSSEEEETSETEKKLAEASENEEKTNGANEENGDITFNLSADFSTASGESSSDSSDKKTLSKEPVFALSESSLPSISVPATSVTSIGDLSYKLSYTITPAFTSQISYDSSEIDGPDDFVWSDMQSTYIQVKSPTVLTSALGYKGNFMSLTDTFTFNPVYQSHPYISDSYSESSANSLKKADYNARKLDLTNTNAFVVKPFYYTEHFSSTALTWNTTVKMIRTQYISDDIENPMWEYLTTDFTDEECVTVHNLNLVLAATEGNFGQSLSLSTTLPPQVDEYSGILSLTFPYTTFSIGTGIEQTSSDDDTWILQDLSQSLAITLFSSNLKFTQSYIYDLEDKYVDSFKLALSGYGLQLAYTMSYTTDYEFEEGSGWISQDSKSFQPYSFSLAYTKPSKTYKYWTDRIAFAPSLSTSIVYDCVKPTSSYFKFIPAITFKVNNFLDITFSSESKNSSIYRYFGRDLDKYYGEGADIETNVFKDLIDSFRFDDEEKRKKSAFKLKSLNVEITHDLHDWDLSCEFSISPTLVSDTSGSYYSYDPYFSISVSWRPMASMKTEIVDEYGEWQLNP